MKLFNFKVVVLIALFAVSFISCQKSDTASPKTTQSSNNAEKKKTIDGYTYNNNEECGRPEYAYCVGQQNHGNLKATFDRYYNGFIMRIEKCDGTRFIADGTAYIKLNNTCGTVIKEKSYRQNDAYIEIYFDYYIAHRQMVRFYPMTITHSSGYRSNGGDITVYRE